MARTTKPTRAWAKFGVYRQASAEERQILELANEYRQELVRLHHAEHKELVHLRNDLFPEILEALIAYEHTRTLIWFLEEQIKQHHSDVRDRDAVLAADRQRLKELREQSQRQLAIVRGLRPRWRDFLQQFREELKEQLPEKVRKGIKKLAQRRTVYDQLRWSTPEIDRCARLSLDYDLARRELSEDYQQQGLNFSIRGAIVAASKPKLTATGPGTRYEYGCQPECRPWRLLCTQLQNGGLPVAEAMQGRHRLLQLQPIYTNHTRRGRGRETVCEVRQQIGNAEYPCEIRYAMKIDKPFPPGAKLQWWLLRIEDNGKRQVVPVISADAEHFRKPCGQGLLTFELRWTRVPGGVLVARFRGDHVCEDLILPDWLVAQRMCVKEVAQDTDNEANDLLEEVGISRSKEPGERHGTDALADYCREHPEDLRLGNRLVALMVRQQRATRLQQRAIRCIEKIYETVVSRLGRRHGQLLTSELDLQTLKKYDSRDLLKGSLPTPVRELMHAVSPGKLRALLERYGLEKVSDLDEAAAQRLQQRAQQSPSDLFTSFVHSLRQKTGTKESGTCRRTQSLSEEQVES